MLAVLVVALGLGLTSQSASLSGPAGLAGRVIDGDTRAPVSGASVTIAGPRARHTVVTDDAGRFQFTQLPADRYRVSAEKMGYVVNPALAGVLTTLTDFAEGLELLLYRSSVISGQIADERGNPLAGVHVQALRRVAAGGRGTFGSQGPPPTTNDLGEFRVASLMAGDYIVMGVPRGESRGSTTLVPTYYPATAVADGAVVVHVRPGETAVGVNITMLSAPAYEISGVVVDEQGRPQAGAPVTLIVQNLQGQLSAQVATRSVPAGKDGTFRFTGVAAGSYRVAAASPSSALPNDPPGARALAGLLGVVSGKTPLVDVDVRDASVSDLTLVLVP
jgi:hypothetical protein